MPTEVILLSNISGLGAEGDRVRVKDGYARNFLLPRRLASPPQAASAKRIEQLRKIRGERETAERGAAEALVRKIKGVVLSIPMPSAQAGKIFGGVTVTQITELLAKQGFILERKQIRLDHPLRSIGEFAIPIHPYAGVEGTVTVVITVEKAESDREDRDEKPARGKKERRPEKPAAAAAEKSEKSTKSVRPAKSTKKE